MKKFINRTIVFLLIFFRLILNMMVYGQNDIIVNDNLNNVKTYYNVNLDEITTIPTSSELYELFVNSFKPAIVTNIFEPLCNDAYSAIMMQKIKAYSNNIILNGSIVTPDDFSGDNLYYARRVLDDSFVLGYMYQVTGEDKYADFLNAELLQLATNLKTWSDYPFLYVYEAITALSVGYVWIGESLNEETKKCIEESVKPKLDVAITFYEPYYKDIATSIGNGSAVGNSAIAISSIAFSNTYPELCSKLLHHSLRAIRLTISTLYPDGASYEGPGYWQYQTQYLTYLFSTLDAVFQNDFGISKVGNMLETGFYHLNMHSSDMRAFNFSDSGESSPQIMTFYYLAKKFDLPYLSAYADAVCPNGVNYLSWEPKHGDVMAMLWREDTHYGYDDLPLNALFGGEQPVSVERSGFYTGATYFAIKGGTAMHTHGSMDAGTFVLDSMGERWAEDLGSDNYNGDGYWDFTDTGRWSYYSQRAEGHNTLVINPDEGADQNTDAIALFEEHNTLDFGNIYNSHKVKRSYKMSDAGHTLTLTDSIIPDGKADIYWFMHTRKNVEIFGDTAVLSSGRKRCVAKIISPSNAEFTLENAKPLIITNNQDAKNFDDFKKLQIYLNTDEVTEIKVEFSFENEEFLIENTKENIVRFNRKIDFLKSIMRATDLHGNEIPLSFSKCDEYTLKYKLNFMHPDNTYFIHFDAVVDADGNALSGETSISISENTNYDNDIYFNGFDEEFITEDTYYETIATRKIDNNNKLMVYNSSSAPAKGESFYKTPLIIAENKPITLECDTTITYTGNEKKIFRLYDSNLNLKCDALVTLSPKTMNNDYKHAWVSVFGSSYFVDKTTGENFELKINRPYKIKAKLDFSVYPAKLRSVSVTELITGKSLSCEYDVPVYISPSFHVGVGQRVWKQDETYFDNISVHYERKCIDVIEIKNEDTVSVILSNYENSKILNAYAASYNDDSLENIKLIKLQTFIGINKFEFENVLGENRRIFIWSEEGVPYE